MPTTPFGFMDSLAAIERNMATGTDAAGQAREDWQVIGETYCAARQLSSIKRAAAEQVHGEATHELTLRIDERIQPGDRLRVRTPQGRLELHWITGIDRTDRQQNLMVIVTSLREAA